jgi:hypothetical protein
MPLVIVSVREELFPETYCWALQECMRQALRAAGWTAEPWVQKVVRLPPAEFTYSSLSRSYYPVRGRKPRRRRSGSSSVPPLKRNSGLRSRISYLASTNCRSKTFTTAESHQHVDGNSKNRDLTRVEGVIVPSRSSRLPCKRTSWTARWFS